MEIVGIKLRAQSGVSSWLGWVQLMSLVKWTYEDVICRSHPERSAQKPESMMVSPTTGPVRCLRRNV